MFNEESKGNEVNKEKRLIIILSFILVTLLVLIALSTFGVNIIDNLQAERAARQERIDQQKLEKLVQMELEDEANQKIAETMEERAEVQEEINQKVQEELDRLLSGIDLEEEESLKLKIKLANRQEAIEEIKNIEANTEYQKWFKDILLSDSVELSKITVAQYLTTRSRLTYLKYNNDVETTYDIINLGIMLNEEFERTVRVTKGLVGKRAIMCKSTYVIEVPEQFKNDWERRSGEQNPCGIFAIIVLDD